jgi:hypothetical protein
MVHFGCLPWSCLAQEVEVGGQPCGGQRELLESKGRLRSELVTDRATCVLVGTFLTSAMPWLPHLSAGRALWGLQPGQALQAGRMPTGHHFRRPDLGAKHFEAQLTLHLQQTSRIAMHAGSSTGQPGRILCNTGHLINSLAFASYRGILARGRHKALSRCKI